MAYQAADSGISSVLLVVAAALVDERGLVLVQQRPIGKHHGGLWEFPGGKVEAGEAPEQALARELREELGIGIDPRDATPAGFASHAERHRHLVLLLYLVRRWTEEPIALEASALAWTSIADLAQRAMPPADRMLSATLATSI